MDLRFTQNNRSGSRSRSSRKSALSRSSKKRVRFGGKSSGSPVKIKGFSFSSSKPKAPTRAAKVVDLRKVVRNGAPASARRVIPKRRPGQGVLRSAGRSQSSRRAARSSGKSRFSLASLPSLKLRAGALSALLVVLVGGLSYGLFFSSFFRVERVVLRGQHRMSQTELRLATAPLLERTVLGVPLNNMFLLSDTALEEAVREANPRVSDVVITRKYPNVIAFDVAERNIAAVWVSGDQIVFLDAQGRVCCDASVDALLEEQVPQLIDLSVRRVAVGDEATLPRHLNYANQLQDLFDRTLPMQIARFELPSAKGPEIHVITAEGVKLLFSLELPAEQQVKIFETVFREEIQDQYESLQYVDLRVDGYAYYQ